MEFVILQSSRRSTERRKFGIEEGKWKWWRQKRTPLDYSAIFILTQLVVRCNAMKGRKMNGRKWHPRSLNVDGEPWLNSKGGPKRWFLVVAIDQSTREKRQETKPCGRMQCIFFKMKRDEMRSFQKLRPEGPNKWWVDIKRKENDGMPISKGEMLAAPEIRQQRSCRRKWNHRKIPTHASRVCKWANPDYRTESGKAIN